jgi:hypothetical protein
MAADKLLNTTETGEIIGVTAHRIRRWCLDGDLDGKKYGRDWFVLRSVARKFAKIPRPLGRPPG